MSSPDRSLIPDVLLHDRNMSNICCPLRVCHFLGISMDPFLSNGSSFSSYDEKSYLSVLSIVYHLVSNALLTGQSSLFGGPKKSNYEK